MIAKTIIIYLLSAIFASFMYFFIGLQFALILKALLIQLKKIACYLPKLRTELSASDSPSAIKSAYQTALDQSTRIFYRDAPPTTPETTQITFGLKGD